MNGKLIVIEGLDGSGKSTQTPLLVRALQKQGHVCQSISFPDYKEPSSALVKMYLAGDFGERAQDVNAYAASSFYAVDRYAAYKRHWGRAYHNGVHTVATRYTTSNAIHQMSKLPSSEWEGYLHWLEEYEYVRLGIPKPDMVIFLDMPIKHSQQLLLERYDGDAQQKDLHERDKAYLLQCQETAQFSIRRGGWRVVECADERGILSVEQIHTRVSHAAREIL